MKILVTGATGFLGRNIVDRLSQKHTVEGVYHQGILKGELPMRDAHCVDLRNGKEVNNLISKVKPDTIIQMAATSTGVKDIIERPYIHVTDNAVMNSLLLRAAYDHGVKHFIFPSCTNVYPSSDKPHKETDKTNPHKKYKGGGGTKVYLENMCKFFSGLGRTKHTVMRHSNVYGPHDNFGENSHVMAATIRKVMAAQNGGDVEIWGDGTEKRDLLYVDDLVDFVELAVEKQPDGVYNVGSGDQVSITDLTKEVIKQSYKILGITYDTSKPTIKMNLSLDCRKANKLGWEQKVPLNQGIEKTIEWYQS